MPGPINRKQVSAFMSQALNPSLSNIEHVLKPIEQANGLPNEHYISKVVFEEEKHAIFFNNWAAVDFAKNVPNAGDAKPFDFMGMPLLIVRDGDGSIGVFQNTCRHRGMKLIEHPTTIMGVISCPYHGWCYSTKGELRATPHLGGHGVHTHASIKNEKLGLFQVRSSVWKDIIFVNISGDAPEFRAYAGELMDRWEEFEQTMYHGGESSSYSIDLNTNWKLAVENYSESYHLPCIHPGLNAYSRLADHYNIDEGDIFGGQGTKVYRQLEGEGGVTFPDFEMLSEKWNEGAEYVTLFPNVMLGIHRDHFFSIILEPIDADHTRERVELYYAQDLKDSPEFQDMLDENAERWRTVFSEDIFVVEGMQKSRHGAFFDGGVFSPVLDNATHRFHQWVAKSLEKNRFTG